MANADQTAVSENGLQRLREWAPLLVGWAVVIGLVVNALTHDRGKLLEAPFLSFLAFVLLISVFYRPLSTAMARGTLSIKWGDKEIAITDIEQNLDTQFDELRSELSDLASELEQLRQQAAPASVQNASAEVMGAPSNSSAETEADLMRRIEAHYSIDARMAGIVFHLGTSRYKWRNQKTLIEKAGLPASVLDEFATTRPDVVVRSRAKSGNVIFRLSDQAKLAFFSL